MKISSIEKDLQAWILKHKEILFFLIIMVLNIYVRYKAMDIESVDYLAYLIKWYAHFQETGFSGLQEQVGDYSIPYQVITYLMTLIPGTPLYLFKILSMIFDCVCAVASGLIVKKVTGNKKLFWFTAAVIFSLPCVIMNSTFWAQCDAIWSGFVLLSVYMLMEKRYFPSFLFLALAFSFKMQTVFIFPLFAYYYFKEGGFSLLNVLIIPLVYFLLSCPAFAAGRPISSLFSIYFNQVYEYHEVVINYPSFWALSRVTNFKMYYRFNVLITFLVLGILLYILLQHKHLKLSNPKTLLFFAAVSSWTCVLLLPSMHERYGYLTDILLILLVICDKDYFPYGIIPSLVSIPSYSKYLTGESVHLEWMAFMHIFAYFMILKIASKKLHDTEDVSETPSVPEVNQ